MDLGAPRSCHFLPFPDKASFGIAPDSQGSQVSLSSSSSSPSSSSKLGNKNKKDQTDSSAKEEILFERGPSDYTLMQSGLGFSCFNIAYWIWYTNDFIPVVNASPMPELHIDPMLGVSGIVFASLIQTIFFLYPRRLVSRLTYRPSCTVGGQPVGAQFWIYTHTVPLIRPNTVKPAMIVPVQVD